MIKKLPLSVGIVAVVFLMAYGSWSCKRRINYSFGYESFVHEQIQKELKPVYDRLDKLERK
jgi:hypothetical protein